MPELRYSWESLEVIFNEPNWPDLLREHWEELAVHKDVMPLDPDYRVCYELERQGKFKAWAARNADGDLCGYLAWHLVHHLHYKSTLTAIDDLFLVSKPYRRGLNGAMLFRTCFPELRKLGVRRVIVHGKEHLAEANPKYRRFFTALGFAPMDTLYTMWLG